MATSGSPTTQSLIERLDEATQATDFETITQGVKSALQDCIAEDKLHLDDAWCEPCENGYGRRLVHRDPNGRYSVVAMIWGEGQGTPIHDHDDKWCVECVYQGEIEVTSYEVCPTADPDKVTVEFCGTVDATIGEAGALIPPHDYHVIQNQKQPTAVTIHVYGGEMEGCNVYLPIEGTNLFQRTRKSLCYDDIAS